MTNPKHEPIPKRKWKRPLAASEECLLVPAEDIELLTALLQDSESQQRMRVKLQSFDSSLTL